MKRHLIVLLSVAVVSVAGPLMFTGSLSAHHGRQGTYDAAKEVTLSGAVTEFVWRNPHVVIYLDVKDADGELVNWGLETSSVSTMSRQGWSRNTLRPGQTLSVSLNPAYSGAPIGVITKVTLANGEVIASRGNAATVD